MCIVHHVFLKLPKWLQLRLYLKLKLVYIERESFYEEQLFNNVCYQKYVKFNPIANYRPILSVVSRNLQC